MFNMVHSIEEYPDPGFERLNRLATELSEVKAQELRADAIMLAYEAVSFFLNKDAVAEREYTAALADAADDSAENLVPEPEKFLELDFLASPGLTTQELHDSLSYQLIRNKERAPGDTFGADRIQVFLPVQPDFQMGEEPSELPDLDLINKIYVMFEKDRADGIQVRRFTIARDEVYEYVAIHDPDQEAEMSDIIGRGLHNVLEGAQNLGNLMVAQLLEDHRNFAVKPRNNS